MAGQAAVRFGGSAGAFANPGGAVAALGSLLLLAPGGLALGCRRLWRLGYRRAAGAAGIGLGVLTAAGMVFTGMLRPVAIIVCAVLFSLPVWFAWRRLAPRD